MLTKQQTRKLADRLVAHYESLKEILDGLRAHHELTEAIEPLAVAVQALDDAAICLLDEVTP